MSNHTVKKARKNKGMTQKELAESLQVSRNVVIKIEKGERELKMSEAKKLSELLGIRVEELSGEELPDFEKYKKMLIFVLHQVDGDGKVPKTKLAKLLYLTDFSWYYKHLESMSGMQYRKISYGPVPDAYFRALEELEAENLINMEIKETDDGYKAHLINLTEGGKRVKTDELTEDEKRLMDDICEKWQDKPTAEIVGFTHQQLPFRLSFDGEIISYPLITQVEKADLY